MAFEEARLWNSYTPKINLNPTTLGLIRENLFGRLASKTNHGQMLVSHALAYLGAARNGLTEDELLDLLAADGEYWENLKKIYPNHTLVIRQVPVVIWSRLYFDLHPYLAEYADDNTVLLGFYHRQLWQAAERSYLAGETGVTFHRLMASYFQNQRLYLTIAIKFPTSASCLNTP